MQDFIKAQENLNVCAQDLIIKTQVFQWDNMPLNQVNNQSSNQ